MSDIVLNDSNPKARIRAVKKLTEQPVLALVAINDSIIIIAENRPNVLNNPIEEERFSGEPRALVIAPTRELVVQIGKIVSAKLEKL